MTLPTANDERLNDICVEQLKDECVRMEKALEERGFIDASVEMVVNYSEFSPLQIRLNAADLRYDHENNPWINSGHVGGISEALAQAWLICHNAKDPEQCRRDKVLSDLGRLIDDARDVGFDVEFLNPLEEAMIKLSENVIEHLKAS